jgi:multiple sugar transport system permease protein
MYKHWVKWVLLGPALAVVAAVTTYPLINTIILSFRQWKLNQSPTPQGFIGLDNYVRAFTDKYFWNSIEMTIYFVLISVFVAVAIGLLFAVILQRKSRLNTIGKTLLIFPFAVAPALKGFSWRFMLNPSFGIYDTILDTIFPFAANITWLSEPFWAIWWIAFSEIWGWAPLIALMFLGALGSINPEVFESAKIDGVNNIQLFFHITLPMLRPIIIIITLLKTIWSMKMFDQVVTMTGGGPGRATQFLNYYVYLHGFRYIDMGYAATLAVILLVAMTIFTTFYVKSIYQKGE